MVTATTAAVAIAMAMVTVMTTAGVVTMTMKTEITTVVTAGVHTQQSTKSGSRRNGAGPEGGGDRHHRAGAVCVCAYNPAGCCITSRCPNASRPPAPPPFVAPLLCPFKSLPLLSLSSLPSLSLSLSSFCSSLLTTSLISVSSHQCSSSYCLSG